MLSAPLASYAQPSPVPVPTPQSHPQAAGPRGHRLDGVFALVIVALVAGLFAHRH
ncbi:MAG: hypothetical protein P8Q26_02170 [Ascidiaceihabitans sp.]|nr:hypothetical protein [Ascidiaceihabitans sp.]